jgi:hypothetical protein
VAAGNGGGSGEGVRNWAVNNLKGTRL